MKNSYLLIIVSLLLLTSCVGQIRNSTSLVSSTNTPSTTVSTNVLTTSTKPTLNEPTSSKPSTNSTTSTKPTSIVTSQITSEQQYVCAYFYNAKNKLIYSDYNVEIGTTPIFKGDLPTKQSDDKYHYTFSSWSPSLGPIYEDTYYYPIFTSEQYYYPISDLISWDDTLSKPVFDGMEITINNAAIHSVYSDNRFTISDDSPLFDFSAIEVFSKESISPTFTSRDIVNVTGTISSFDNKAVLKDASLTWGDDGKYNCDDRGSVGKHELYDREDWETFSRNHSGQLYYANMQIASLPEIKTGEELFFYTVFPGEDLTINEDNYFLIKMVIPPLKEEQLTKVNEKISALSVGGGIDITFQPTYDGTMFGTITYDRFEESRTTIPYTIDNIYTSYSEVSEFINEGFPRKSILDMSDTSIYNYVINTGWERYDDTYREFYEISAYTYDHSNLLNKWNTLYSNNEEWENLGLIEGEYWYKTSYGEYTNLLVSFKEYRGKCVFIVHLRDK